MTNQDIDGLSILTLNLLRRITDAEVDRKAVSLVCLVYTYYLYTLDMLCVYIFNRVNVEPYMDVNIYMYICKIMWYITNYLEGSKYHPIPNNHLVWLSLLDNIAIAHFIFRNSFEIIFRTCHLCVIFLISLDLKILYCNALIMRITNSHFKPQQITKWLNINFWV